MVTILPSATSFLSLDITTSWLFNHVVYQTFAGLQFDLCQCRRFPDPVSEHTSADEVAFGLLTSFSQPSDHSAFHKNVLSKEFQWAV
jgi:hypothetical protein